MEECQIGISVHTTRQMGCPLQLRCARGFCIFFETGKHQTAFIVTGKLVCQILKQSKISPYTYNSVFDAKQRVTVKTNGGKMQRQKIPGQVNLWSDCTACHYFANVPVFISLFFIGQCPYTLPLSSAVHCKVNNSELMLLKLR